jgi:hypothetical protein
LKIRGKITAIILAVSLASCSSIPSPTWIDTGSTQKYPDSKYITSSGCGKTLQEARSEARSGIARKLLTKVDSVTRMSTNLTINKNGQSVEKNSSSTDNFASQVSLAGMSYPKVFRESSKNVCVLGVMNKNRARLAYHEDISVAEKDLWAYKRELSSHNKLSELRAAAAVLGSWNQVNADNQALKLLSHSPFGEDTTPEEVKKAQKIVKKLGSIRVEASQYSADPGAANRLVEATKTAFEAAGFRESASPAFVVVVGVPVHNWITDAITGTRFEWSAKIDFTEAGTGKIDATQEASGVTAGEDAYETLSSVQNRETADFEKELVIPLVDKIISPQQ